MPSRRLGSGLGLGLGLGSGLELGLGLAPHELALVGAVNEKEDKYEDQHVDAQHGADLQR